MHGILEVGKFLEIGVATPSVLVDGCYYEHVVVSVDTSPYFPAGSHFPVTVDANVRMASDVVACVGSEHASVTLLVACAA